jgi:NitT/TauT family transport system substrate-binding protein
LDNFTRRLKMKIQKRIPLIFTVIAVILLPVRGICLEKVTIAYSPSLSFAPLFIAIEKGYLKEEGIEVNLEIFKSGSEAVVFAATGKIEAIAGGIGASNFNAASKGMNVKIVAPMAIQPTKGAPAPILVRSDLVDKIKTPRDLRGRRIAVGGGAGATGEYMLMRVLEKAGLERKDVNLVNLAFPDMPLAIAKKSVDAGLIPAPFSIVPLEDGTAKILVPVCTPGEMVTVISFGENFMEKTPKVAEAVVRAVMKATRDLVKAGQYTEEFISIFLKYYKIDRAKLVKIDLYDFDPNLKIQGETLREMERVFGKNGQLDYKQSLPLDKLIEPSFVNAVVQKMGLYKK